MNAESVDPLVVSVVLPCLNEEDSVGPCVIEATNALKSAGWRGEVIVVDNGCTDGSVSAAISAGAKVVREEAPGYGAAILRGIFESRGEVVVMADADLTYPLDRLSELVGPVLNGDVDIMIGSRLEGATMQSMPFLHRYLGTPTLTWLIRRATGHSGLSDSQSGFRAFRRDKISELGLRATGMEFASEMLVRSAQMSFRIEETPLGYRERVGESKLSTWRDGKRHLKLILMTSPNLLLWYPGLVLLALGLGITVFSIINGDIGIGSLRWQPVFFGPILLTLGMISSMCGAVMAHHSHWATASTRSHFSWITRETAQNRLRLVGILCIIVGIAIDAALFFKRIDLGSKQSLANVPLAGLAQGLLLDGILLFGAVGVYRFFMSSIRVVDSESVS